MVDALLLGLLILIIIGRLVVVPEWRERSARRRLERERMRAQQPSDGGCFD